MLLPTLLRKGRCIKTLRSTLLSNHRSVHSCSFFWDYNRCSLPFHVADEALSISKIVVDSFCSVAAKTNNSALQVQIIAYTDLFSPSRPGSEVLKSLKSLGVKFVHVEKGKKKKDNVKIAMASDFHDFLLRYRNSCSAYWVSDIAAASNEVYTTRYLNSNISSIVPRPTSLPASIVRRDTHELLYWEDFTTGSLARQCNAKVVFVPHNLQQNAAYNRQLIFIQNLKPKIRLLFHANGGSLSFSDVYSKFEDKHNEGLRFKPNQVVSTPGQKLSQLTFFAQNFMDDELSVNAAAALPSEPPTLDNTFLFLNNPLH